jgi:hypothetical protein
MGDGTLDAQEEDWHNHSFILETGYDAISSMAKEEGEGMKFVWIGQFIILLHFCHWKISIYLGTELHSTQKLI